MHKTARRGFRWGVLLALLLTTVVTTGAQSGVRAVVSNDTANVRIFPAIGAEVIANVPSGYVFEFVTGRSGDGQWLRVEFNGDEAWVGIAPLTILSGDVNALPVGDPRSIPYGGFEAPRSGQSSATSVNTVRVTNGLRVRSGPGQGYPTLANMFAGTVVPVFGRTISNRWVQVNYQGTLGWVSSGFLEFQNGLAITSL
ncbi:MAG: SH3 domain-containing protein, partial [Armatimonadetes bacterium]|nr:SH3 domain-containing protein [Anaerolineae bacterium]